VVAGAGVAAVQLTGDGSGSSADAWDAEIRPFVDFVEEERGLEFRNPVRVELMTDEAFRRQVTADEDELTDEEREEFEHTAGIFRALGLIDGDVDLFTASNHLAGEGILGYYSVDDKLIRIRATTLTPATKTTLVHELTHALQDQHFDIGSRRKKFEDSEDSEKGAAFAALVEGDASRIENAYRQDLSPDERGALEKEEAASIDEYTDQVADVPEVLRTLISAPYSLGESVLGLAVTLDGNDAVDELFDEPPTTAEHLLDPWTLVRDHDRAADVPQPELEVGERAFDEGSFGAMMWYLLLAERLPHLRALDATDGWAGDSFVGFQREGVTCLRTRYRGDTGDDRAQMRTALQAWIAADPRSTAKVTTVGRDLVFESCDPGGSAEGTRDSSDSPLGLPLSRTYLAINFLEFNDDASSARCLANGFVHEFTLEQIADPTLGTDDPAQRRKLEAVALACR
jgi:hypothetical protein